MSQCKQESKYIYHVCYILSHKRQHSTFCVGHTEITAKQQFSVCQTLKRWYCLFLVACKS
uniref:Uncharacterized protein n=1 Tax=Arundo donax TaxID=35708 RepID=A0A0A8ZKZ0_ARUDO